jgi:hypothetical protein
MSETIANPREFFVDADHVSIKEIRMSDDVLYVMQVYAGIGNFIRMNLRDETTGEPPTLPKFLRDLADMSEAATAAMEVSKHADH